MKASELRIGNLVEDEYKRVQIVEEMDIPFAKDYYIISFKGDDYTPIDKTFPIPLTEEYLIKFGFKQWGDKYTFGLKGINIHHRKRGFVLRKSVPVIKSVHQLQNLYFALTGKELIQNNGDIS